MPRLHPLPLRFPQSARGKSKKRGFCFCERVCSRKPRRAVGCGLLRFEDNPTALTSFETAEVFLCAASSKQHLRCSGLPKGNPQTPQYCFSFSPKISGIALRFSGCPLFMAHHYRSAAHSPFLQERSRANKGALTQKRGFACASYIIIINCAWQNDTFA